MENRPGIFKRLFKFIWQGINFTRSLFINLIFVVILLALIDAAISEEDQFQITQNSALVLDLDGYIVEQKHYVSPMEEFIDDAFGSNDKPRELLLSDIVEVIEHASIDQRISAIVLDLESMQGASMVKLKTIGTALEKFKEKNKTVVAKGDYYTQSQYYLASYADEIMLDPLGGISLNGMSRYRMYYREALEKLDVTPHIFRVGTFKSAVEPYLRNNMSDEAKIANKAWLNELWTQYKDDIAARRGIEESNFDETFESLNHKFSQVDYDFGEYALDNKWVDQLITDDAFNTHMLDIVSADSTGNNFAKVGFANYLKFMKMPQFPQPGGEKVALIVAQGEIADGSREPGQIGGDSTAALLKRARLDDAVKAVVMRVDSPGGSMTASEKIRREVDLIKAAGKPVVVSMGSVAASGGYWISASANEIWAEPTTITGSIGIFGMFATFEKTLANLGVYADGVATTELASAHLFRPLPEGMKNMVQKNIERGYRRFINLVAENRELAKEDVEKIAQGRVWTGTQALSFGLVDKLGSLDDAVQSAAQYAGLTNYDVKLIEKELSPTDKFFKELLDGQQSTIAALVGEQVADSSSVTSKISYMLNKQLKQLNTFNDPQGAYILCTVCDVN